MPFNVNDFRSKFKAGFSRPNMFKVQILGLNPANITSLGPEGVAFAAILGAFMEELEFSCYECELPGKLIGTTPFRDYGPTVEIPFGGVYSPVNMNFYVSKNMIQKQLFSAWHEFIVSNLINNDVAYYQDITATVIITQYDEGGNEVYRVILEEAYPKNVGQMNLSWDTKNEVHKMNVEMTYRSWTGIPL